MHIFYKTDHFVFFMVFFPNHWIFLNKNSFRSICALSLKAIEEKCWIFRFFQVLLDLFMRLPFSMWNSHMKPFFQSKICIYHQHTLLSLERFVCSDFFCISLEYCWDLKKRLHIYIIISQLCLSSSLSVFLSVCPFAWLFVCPSVCLSIRKAVCLSVCPNGVCLTVRLSERLLFVYPIRKGCRRHPNQRVSTKFWKLNPLSP